MLLLWRMLVGVRQLSQVCITKRLLVRVVKRFFSHGGVQVVVLGCVFARVQIAFLLFGFQLAEEIGKKVIDRVAKALVVFDAFS